MIKVLKKLLANWSGHFLVVWIAIIAFTLIPYLYHVHIWGDFKYNADGSPVSGWQYALKVRKDLLVIALFLFLAEIVRQFLFKKYHFTLFMLGCLLTGIISSAGRYFLHPHLQEQQGKLSIIEPILIMAAYAFTYAILRDYYHQNENKKLNKIQQSENELHALKAQLNPHFLFNALNYLYGTALKEKAQDTAQGIDLMSDMMRYTIHGMHENFVPLADELKFIENYLQLQHARLPEKDSIKISTQIVSDDDHHMVAPLLLLPFIENAFKYGISIDSPCEVVVKIVVAQNVLHLEVFNTIVQNRAEVKGNNTGIKNTIKRLDLLYSDKYRLDRKNTGLGHKVSLWLKLTF
jgi:sensor histidine kinase YesM